MTHILNTIFYTPSSVHLKRFLRLMCSDVSVPKAAMVHCHYRHTMLWIKTVYYKCGVHVSYGGIRLVSQYIHMLLC